MKTTRHHGIPIYPLPSQAPYRWLIGLTTNASGDAEYDNNPKAYSIREAKAIIDAKVEALMEEIPGRLRLVVRRQLDMAYLLRQPEPVASAIREAESAVETRALELAWRSRCTCGHGRECYLHDREADFFSGASGHTWESMEERPEEWRNRAIGELS